VEPYYDVFIDRAHARDEVYYSVGVNHVDHSKMNHTMRVYTDSGFTSREAAANAARAAVEEDRARRKERLYFKIMESDV
jgi:hypothetical protein